LSHSHSQDNAPVESNVVSMDSSEAQKILTEIRALRRRVIDAWQERGVILTSEEQRELGDEIKYTCELLTVLTSRG